MGWNYQCYEDGKLVYEKQQLTDGTHCTVNLFWMSSAVPLLILILHFAREWCFPTNCTRRLLLLYSYDSDIQPPKQPPAMVYDSGRRHDNLTGKAVETSRNDAGNEKINIVFEDEEVALFNKKRGLLVAKSPWMFGSKLKSLRLPLANEHSVKLWLASFLWGIQFWIYHRAGLEAFASAKPRRLAKSTAILGFIGPMTAMFLSIILSVDSIKAVKRSSDDARWWVAKPMGFLILIGLLYLPIPFFRMLFA